ncbi:hypothetical protein VPH35_039068 [Triticum aestivum]
MTLAIYVVLVVLEDDPKSEEESTLHNQKLPQIGETYIDPFLPMNSLASTKSVVKDYTTLHSQNPLQYMDVMEDLRAQSSSCSSRIACLRALIDPDQELSCRLWRQSLEALKNHYALDIEMACSGGYVPNINAPRNSQFYSLLHRIKDPVNQSMRLINVKVHGNNYATLLHHPFLFKGKPTHAQEVATPHILTLATHAFPTYYIVEHGGPHHRQIIMLRFAGSIVQMSHQKHSSKVIEKCLMYASYHDCKLVINEILFAGGGQTADHLMGMIIHQYSNCMVWQMIDVVNDRQFNVIVDVLRCNRDTLVMYAHGRQVIAQVERLLNGMAPSPNSFGSQFLSCVFNCFYNGLLSMSLFFFLEH